ncbi:MAG TPA: hypothetical protein VGD16_04125 [Enterovirga sp.]
MEPSAPDQHQTLALPAETPAESVPAPDAVVPEVRAEARPVARDSRVASTSDAPAPEIPVEARESRPAPAAARTLPKRAMVAAGILVGALALGGGAYMLAFDKPRRAAIQIGPVADMPAIRDGIVAVKAAAPAASIAPAAPRASSASLLSPVSSAPSLEMRSAAPVQPAPAALAPPPAPPVEPPTPAETASITPAPGVPLPPPRPLVERAELRPDRPAVQPRRQAARPAPPVQTVAEAAPAEQAPPERTKLLGVPLPDLAQTGRDIKDGVASFGETVLNLPKRF